MNDKAREDMKEHPNPEVKKAGSESTTITHAAFTPYGEGQSKVARGSSRAVVSDQDATWSAGDGASDADWYTKTDEGKRELIPLKKDSDICKESEEAEPKHTYANANPGGKPHTSHTESRILEDLWKDHKGSPGTDGKIGKVVLNIDWQTTEWAEGDGSELTAKGKPKKVRKQVHKKVPCEHCEELIRNASACFDIVICGGADEKPAKPKRTSL